MNTANQNYLPGRRIFGDNGNETSTTWNYKVIGRYVMPWEIGLLGFVAVPERSELRPHARHQLPG